MNWNECLICQSKTTEDLKCPMNAPGRGEKSEIYISLLNNANAFRILGALPVNLNFEENMTVEELTKNRAAWHKSCHVKFSNDKLERATKKHENANAAENSASLEKRPRRQAVDKMSCLFCQRDDGNLHEFTKLGPDSPDETIRNMAKELNETELISRIAGGDLVAIDGKYHLDCLTTLRNRYRSLVRQREQELQGSNQDKQMKARALVEIITYVENCIEDGVFYFKFSVLHQMYENRLKNLGFDKGTNRNLIKDKLLAYFPQAQEQSDGKNKILVFEQGMQQMLKQAMAIDYEGDALLLAKVAKLVRKEIVNYEGFHFDGKFP